MITQHAHRYWLAIRLPHIALDSLGISYFTEEKILVSFKNQVWGYSQALEQSNITLGMPTPTAKILEQVKTYDTDINTINKTLDLLINETYAYTPYIEKYITNNKTGVQEFGLLIELSSSIKLFKGLNNLVLQIKSKLNSLSIDACYGLSYTRGAAWLLSFSNTPLTSDNIEKTTPKNQLKTLSRLSLTHIKNFPKDVQKLNKMGFYTLGNLIQQSNKGTATSLKKRISSEFYRFLEETLSFTTHLSQESLFTQPNTIYTPVSRFSHTIQLDVPVNDTNVISQLIKAPLQKLTHYLIKKQWQTQNIEWHLFDIYKNTTTLEIHLDHLHNDWGLAHELTNIHLEKETLPFEVDSICLICDKTTPLERGNQPLSFTTREALQNTRDIQRKKEITLTKLISRIGKNNVFKIHFANSHIPEESYCINKNVYHDNIERDFFISSMRPTWLYTHPERITHNSQNAPTPFVLLQGPERIESNWWNAPIARDYFIAQQTSGQRVWLYKNLTNNQWFIHGIFS